MNTSLQRLQNLGVGLVAGALRQLRTREGQEAVAAFAARTDPSTALGQMLRAITAQVEGQSSTPAQRVGQAAVRALQSWGAERSAAHSVYDIGAAPHDAATPVELVARELGTEGVETLHELPPGARDAFLSQLRLLADERVASGGPRIPMTELPGRSHFYDGNPRSLVREERGLAALRVFEAMPPAFQDVMVRRLHGERESRVTQGGPRIPDRFNMKLDIDLNDTRALLGRELGHELPAEFDHIDPANQRALIFEARQTLFARVAQGGAAVPFAALPVSKLWDARNPMQLVHQELGPNSVKMFDTLAPMAKDGVVRGLMQRREERVAVGGPVVPRTKRELVGEMPTSARGWIAFVGGPDAARQWDHVRPPEQRQIAFEARLTAMSAFLERALAA